MLLILSPSKTLDEISPIPDISYTQPCFLKEAEKLVYVLRNYSSGKLSQLMDISDKLSSLNVARYEAFSLPFTRNNSRPCLFMFKGDVYEPMDVSEYTVTQLAYAQEHLRILSGLYGILRPLDLIQAYRLEMGTRLRINNHRDLYQFWGDKITIALNDACECMLEKTVINLASVEYFGAVKPAKLKGRLINIVFKESYQGGYRVVALHAKKARGMMADYAIKNRIAVANDLKAFQVGGYRYSSDLSGADDWVFIR